MRVVFPAGFAIAFLFAFGFVAAARHGSVSGAIAYAHGYAVTVDASEKSVGTITLGDQAQITFRITNVSPRRLKLIGSSSSCSCIRSSDLPIELAAGEMREITFAVSGGSRSGEFSFLVELFVDSDGKCPRLKIIGEIDSEKLPDPIPMKPLPGEDV